MNLSIKLNRISKISSSMINLSIIPKDLMAWPYIILRLVKILRSMCRNLQEYKILGGREFLPGNKPRRKA